MVEIEKKVKRTWMKLSIIDKNICCYLTSLDQHTQVQNEKDTTEQVRHKTVNTPRTYLIYQSGNLKCTCASFSSV